MRAYENWVHACIQGDSVGVHIANQAAESQVREWVAGYFLSFEYVMLEDVKEVKLSI